MSLTDAAPADAARAAKAASHVLATLSVDVRNDALQAMHDGLAAHRDAILAANALDVAAAQADVQAGHLSSALVSRLDLARPGKWDDMLQGLLDVRGLPDPIGRVALRTRLDDGLVLERVSCPIGVLLVIFEARPEVLANIAALAVKSGNAALLKGGKESTRTMVAMGAALAEALATVPQLQVFSDCAPVQLVTRRDAVHELLALDRDIDLVVPRGSNELVRAIKAATRIPVLGHADGLCSIYLDADYHDAEKAAALLVDAKTSYPAACNSVETWLVHERALAQDPFAAAARALVAAGVTLHCDEASRGALERVVGITDHHVVSASPADYDTEFLSLDLAVRAVPDVAAAIQHINHHGSHHTDAILTDNAPRAEHFLAAVDAAGVYWNASTRFADGTRYGFGTEVGISTSKIHARGPVGLEGLTIYKYKLRGQGHVASAYGEAAGQRRYKHEALSTESN